MLKHGDVLVHGYQRIDSQKVELLVVVVQVKVMVDEEYLVVEREVVEFLVWYQSLDFQGVKNLDFVVRELKSLGQMNQYQIELWQVLVEFVQGLDYEKGKEFHSDLEFLMDQTLCQSLQMFVGLDVLVE